MKQLTKDNILDLIYDTDMEFNNALDYDYESEYKHDLTECDLNMLKELLDRFCFKLENIVNDKIEKE